MEEFTVPGLVSKEKHRVIERLQYKAKVQRANKE